jgi:hypothetical protein
MNPNQGDLMHRTRIPLAASALFAAAAPFFAQSYGTEIQVLTLGAAAFQPVSSTTAYTRPGGYISGLGGYTAHVPLPVGAVIDYFCIYIDDPDVGLVQGAIWAQGLPAGGQAREYVQVAFVEANFDIGPATACEDGIAHTVLPFNPVTFVNLTYVATVSVFGDAEFGGARIGWHRQVSPAPANATFGDVPSGDAAFPFVEALAASGITAGCGGGNYCPDAPLTRRQMAVFLAKALGLHWTAP